MRISRLMILPALLLLFACDNDPPEGWGPRLERVDINPVTFAKGMKFRTYIARTHDMIRKVTAKLPKPPSESIIELRLPQDLLPDAANCATDAPPRGNVLLIHGAFDSPFSVRDVADAFSANCFHARSILLPGHGTVPGQALDVTLDQWRAAVAYGIDSFDEGNNVPLYIVGYSMGGGLAVDYVLNHKNPRKIAGIVGIAPGLTGPNVAPIGQRLLASINSFLGIRQYLSLQPDIDPVKYESGPIAIALGYVALQDALGDMRDGPSLDIPFYAVMSDVDQTVPISGPMAFFCNRVKGRKTFLVYSENGYRGACPHVAVRHSADPALGLLEAAHTSVLFRPDNPIRGFKGLYRDCRHYWETARKSYARCEDQSLDPANSDIRFAETRPDTLDRYTVRRAGFNPDFDHMMAEIIVFLENGDQAMAASSD